MGSGGGDVLPCRNERSGFKTEGFESAVELSSTSSETPKWADTLVNRKPEPAYQSGREAASAPIKTAKEQGGIYKQLLRSKTAAVVIQLDCPTNG